VIDVNLWGVIHGVRAFLPHLRAGGRGHVVNTASMAGLMPGLNPIYDVTKHAVVALTEDLYHSTKDLGIPVGVSVLCPGWVRTNLLDAERNWPAAGDVPDESLPIQVIEPHLRRAIDEGLTPAAVADIVVRGIEDDRFWLLTHPDWMPMAVRRWDAIAEGVNPPSLDELPDMPTKAQMIEEAFAKMADDADA
jgi:NAD(P)-dependent dehydrogenase (short-subunit alcohol dehydrogenase family)